jgi:hypothetical protein
MNGDSLLAQENAPHNGTKIAVFAAYKAPENSDQSFLMPYRLFSGLNNKKMFR